MLSKITINTLSIWLEYIQLQIKAIAWAMATDTNRIIQGNFVNNYTELNRLWFCQVLNSGMELIVHKEQKMIDWEKIVL